MSYTRRSFATLDQFTDEVQRAPRVAAAKAFADMQQAEATGDQAAAWRSRMKFDRLKQHIMRLESLR